GLDDAAQSSFLMDYDFSSAWRLLLFAPISILYYFFAPFPWMIQNLTQAFSLLEVFLIYSLAWPCYKGIQVAFQKNRHTTLTILCFVLLFSLAQSMTISNLGTVFRHRAFSICLLIIFTAQGIYEIKKNRQIIFKT